MRTSWPALTKPPAWFELEEDVSIRVMKLGGSVVDRPESVERLAAHIQSLDSPPILVHGGGSAVDSLQRRLGMEPVKVDGLRRSRADELEAALMALCGSVNKRLVAGLLRLGVQAVGLAGVDAGLLRVKKMVHPQVDLGFVGEIIEVNPGVLERLLEHGMTPAVAPLSLGPGGQIYNVNADQAASALARSVGSRTIDFVSDVPGVLLDGGVVPLLDPAQARALIAQQRVDGGMVPKLMAAVSAVEAGVPQARIVDLAGLPSKGGTLVQMSGDGDAWRERAGAE